MTDEPSITTYRIDADDVIQDVDAEWLEGREGERDRAETQNGNASMCVERRVTKVDTAIRMLQSS